MYLSIGHRHGAYFVVHNNRLLVFVSEAWSKIPKKNVFHDSGSYHLSSSSNNKPKFILVMKYILCNGALAPIIKMCWFYFSNKNKPHQSNFIQWLKRLDQINCLP
jgi:hypothetical protein